MKLPGDYLIIRNGDNLCCSRHINSELEVVCVKKGPFCIKYEDREIVLNDGEATVILPYRIHGFVHEEGIEANVLMFSYSIAEEFYNRYRVKEMKNDKFVLSGALETFVNQELGYAVESKSTFAIKSIFFPLVSEYLKDNECSECVKGVAGDVRAIIDYISENVTEGITTDDVARNVGMSKAKISRIFKSYMGVGFNEFISTVRMEKACNMILCTDLSITEVAFRCGFGSLRNFNRIFMKMIKCTPGELRKNGKYGVKLYNK